MIKNINIIKKSRFLPYYFILFYCLVITILSLSCSESFLNLINSLKKIILEPDVLITDYIALVGISGAFFNSALVLSLLTLIILYLDVEPTGPIIAGLFTTAGFSLFGKNIVNIWPIILGIWLYSKYQKIPFSNFAVIMLFGTTLAPTLNSVLFSSLLPNIFSIVLSLFISILLGFILPPMASYTLKLHQGYSLANVGLAGGLLGTALSSIFSALGVDFEKKLLWSSGNNLILGLLLTFIFTSIIILGFLCTKNSSKSYSDIFKFSGRLVTDFYTLLGPRITFFNIGILGLISMIFVLAIGSDINGCTISGIFTVAGFGAFGKHLKNIFPLILGSSLAALLSVWEINSPSMVLGILFSTTLCPIAGNLGFMYGIIAGFLHICMVTNIGYLHGGMNLYHNGFAAGFVAIILVPLIIAFRKEPNI